MNIKTKLTCKNCGKSFVIYLTTEEEYNDYDITCDNCGNIQPISQYEKN